MAAPGDSVAMGPALRVDHRTSLRRSLMLKVTKSASSKPDSMSESDQNMGFIKHERTLSEKAKALQERKRREQEMLAGRSIPVGLPLPVGRRTPRHVDLLDFAPQRAREYNDEKVRAQVGASGDSMATSISYMADPPPPPPRDQSTRHIAYKKHLEESYGLSMNERPKPAAVHRLGPQDTPFSRPESDMSIMTADSMAVNFHMSPSDNISTPSSKAPKPKLQVTVPNKQTAAPSSKHLIHQFNRSKNHRCKQSDVSPPSSTTQQKPRGEAPARLSIVSPLSVVEMPKPRRPFSTFSLEDMTSEIKEPPKSAPLQKSTSSDSEDNGLDDVESNYSRPSSTSSLSDPPTILQDLEDRPHSTFSVMNPTAAGVFDNMPAVPSISKHHLKHAKSTASIRLNTNKPLPPEPGLEEIQPLRLPSLAYSRNSIHGKRKAPAPLTISRSSTIDTNGRLPSRVSSLRSKYTPADLDALDAAFVDPSPQTHHHHSKHPSLEQAELELEAHLNTIDEDDFGSPESVTFAHDPLQVSRGPNHMVPSRDAPQPPNSTNIKLSDGSTSNRKRLSKKPSIHVAMQMKTQEHDGGELRKRISAPFGLSQKANRILGEPTAIDFAAPMKREASKESNWSSDDSPDTSYDESSSSPDMSGREHSSTPETDASSLPDPAFEEVKARLELLSPQNDKTSYWSSRRMSHPPYNEAKTEDASKTLSSHVSQYDIPIQLDDRSEFGDIQARRGRDFKDHARSLASIAVSEIHDLYAELPPPLPSPFPRTRDEMSAEEVDRMISADAAEKVLLLILQNLENLSDLFATATVSRGFYRTFKRHELPLMKSALKGMSPAAWELREMSPPYPGLESEDATSPQLEYTPALYLQHYMRDMYTMIALKSMILIHCESFLRPDTITALAGGETARASQIDDAFWRVWTFCQIFGCGSNREDDIISQMDWLRGGVQAKQRQLSGCNGSLERFNLPSSFGKGNMGGLTAEDLYDMTEIWTCLGVLVRGFQGKRQEARDFGIFDKADITAGDVEAEDTVLEEWTYHLLTLAPPTVLDITSPNSPNASNFAHARAKGYTNWTPPPISRATFLKEAVSRVYQEKVAKELISPNSPQATITAISKDTIGNPNPDEAPVNETVAARWRVQRHAAEIRARKMDPNFRATPLSEDRPMSDWTSVVAALDNGAGAKNAPPIPKYHHHRGTPSESDTAKHMVSALVVPAGPQVRDPVDVAVEKLVGMGFEAAKAKKALAETDTGNSINFEHALEYLVRQRKRDVSGLMHEGYRGKAEERGVLRTQQLQEQIEHERLMQQGLEGLASPVFGAAVVGLGIGGMDRRFG